MEICGSQLLFILNFIYKCFKFCTKIKWQYFEQQLYIIHSSSLSREGKKYTSWIINKMSTIYFWCYVLFKKNLSFLFSMDSSSGNIPTKARFIWYSILNDFLLLYSSILLSLYDLFFLFCKSTFWFSTSFMN